MHTSALTFGLVASLLVVMLVIMPFLNQNNSFFNSVMAQEYDDYYGDSSYSTYPSMITNISVEQVHLNDFL